MAIHDFSMSVSAIATLVRVGSALLLALLIWLVWRQSHQTGRKVMRSMPHRGPQGNQRQLGMLDRKLTQMLQGDRAAAQRLVERAQTRYPDRDVVWCYEKVIADLERDRFR